MWGLSPAAKMRAGDSFVIIMKMHSSVSSVFLYYDFVSVSGQVIFHQMAFQSF